MSVTRDPEAPGKSSGASARELISQMVVELVTQDMRRCRCTVVELNTGSGLLIISDPTMLPLKSPKLVFDLRFVGEDTWIRVPATVFFSHGDAVGVNFDDPESFVAALTPERAHALNRRRMVRVQPSKNEPIQVEISEISDAPRPRKVRSTIVEISPIVSRR